MPRGHDEARDDDVEQRRRADEALAVGEAGRDREGHGDQHDHRAELDGASESRPDVDHPDALHELGVEFHVVLGAVHAVDVRHNGYRHHQRLGR